MHGRRCDMRRISDGFRGNQAARQQHARQCLRLRRVSKHAAFLDSCDTFRCGGPIALACFIQNKS